VASIVDDKPFPTLYWLVDREINYRIDQLEAAGVITTLQVQVDGNETLRLGMAADHQDHIALRERLMTGEDQARIDALGYRESLSRRGIGGIENPNRIRCLHTWYAAHLVVPNTIGRLVDDLLAGE
jgi:hypothetical protein